MKFTADKNALMKVISYASRVVEKRNTIPILSNVLLQAEGNELSLTATDLDLEITLKTSIETEIGGATTVNAHLFNEIVRKMAGDKVSFSLDDDRMMKIGAGRSSFKLHSIPASDFPSLTAGSFSHHFAIKSSDLRTLISKTQFAMSSEETRYYLCGVFFHRHDDKLRAVATDGHRLALCNIDAPYGSGGMPQIIMPRKTVGELLKILDISDTADVSISESKIRFQIGDCVMTSKLIDGTFPDYQRVIPSGGNLVALADTKSVAVAADRVSTVSLGKSRAIKLSFSNNLLTLAVNSPDAGNAEDEVPVSYDGDEISIGFNNRYLQDILDNITSKSARITLTEPGSPALIEDEKGDDTLFVLMPMRI